MSNHERRKNGQFRKGTHWRPRKPHWSKRWLNREYVTNRRSAADIASECGCKENNILYWLHKHGIPRREMKQIRKDKKWGLRGKANGMYGRCGPQSPSYKTGSTPERQKAYTQSFWKELAKAVLVRDGYKCGRCGCGHTSGTKLHAHHVRPWATNPEYRFTLSNVVTLCKACHLWVHSKGNIDREYLA